jgi:hypothetical protein
VTADEASEASGRGGGSDERFDEEGTTVAEAATTCNAFAAILDRVALN